MCENVLGCKLSESGVGVRVICLDFILQIQREKKQKLLEIERHLVQQPTKYNRSCFQIRFSKMQLSRRYNDE